MILFPAIDLYEGKAVRLLRGDYENMTVYSDDQSPFFSSSEEMNQPVSNVIPAYSGDVEIWCAVAVG